MATSSSGTSASARVALSLDDAVARAGRSLTVGQAADAERLLLQILAYDPSHVAALNLLAMAQQHQNRGGDARRVLGRAVGVAPDNAALPHNLGVLLQAAHMPEEAEAAFAEARRRGFNAPSPPGFTAAVHIFDDIAAWAAAADHPVSRGPVIPPAPTPDLDGWPAGVRWLTGEVAKASARPPMLVQADDLRLVYWRWAPTAKIPRGEELLVPLSRANGVVWDPFWLAHYPFVRDVDPATARCTFDVRPFAPTEVRLDGEYFLLGGKNNYGHWLADFLPNLWYLRAANLPSHVKIATTGLNSWQRDTLSCFALDREIVELDPPSERRCTVYSFARAWVPGELPLAARFTFIRAAFAAAAAVAGTPAPAASDIPFGAKHIFVSRALTQGSGRVANEAEIAQALAAAGFAVVNGEALDTRAKARLFGQAEIVVVGPGSTNFNHFAFANERCRLINLWPAAAFLDAPLNLLKGALWFSVPFLDRTHFVLGDPLAAETGDAAPGPVRLDDPAVYPVERVLDAITAARARLDVTPS